MTSYETEQAPKRGVPEIDQTTPNTGSRIDEILEHMINLVPEDALVQPDFTTNSTPEDSGEVDNNGPVLDSKEVAAKALIENKGLVRSVAYSSGSRKYNEGLNGSIRRTTTGVRGRFGSISDDDAFQDACEAFLRNYNKFDPEKGTLGNYMTTWMNAAIRRAVGNTTRHVRYPIGVQNKIEPIIFMPNEGVPDTDGVGYDDASDGYLERWLPLEDVGLTPKHDVAYDNSGDDDYIGTKSEQELGVIYKAIAALPERTRHILLCYYSCDEDGKEMTLEKTSEYLELGLSRERMRQIVNTGLNSIRLAIEGGNNDNNEIAENNKAALKKLVQQKLDEGGTVIDKTGKRRYLGVDNAKKIWEEAGNTIAVRERQNQIIASLKDTSLSDEAVLELVRELQSLVTMPQ